MGAYTIGCLACRFFFSLNNILWRLHNINMYILNCFLKWKEVTLRDNC